MGSFAVFFFRFLNPHFLSSIIRLSDCKQLRCMLTVPRLVRVHYCSTFANHFFFPHFFLFICFFRLFHHYRQCVFVSVPIPVQPKLHAIVFCVCCIQNDAPNLCSVCLIHVVLCVVSFFLICLLSCILIAILLFQNQQKNPPTSAAAMQFPFYRLSCIRTQPTDQQHDTTSRRRRSFK